MPIEYDGVSHVLKIVAPIISGGGINHIKIGIADTGDHVYDSGIFISNFAAGNIPGSGIVATPFVACTDSSDSVTGSIQDEYFDLKGGDDTVYAGGGNDIVVAGAGNDSVYGGSGNDEIKGDGGNDLIDGGDGFADIAVYAGASAGYSVVYNGGITGSFTITDSNSGPAPDGTDTLKNIEYIKFSEGLFSLDVNGLTLVSAIVGTPPPFVNSPGILTINGVGSVGNILTATPSDPDGISGSISYQWQISSDTGASWSDISGAVNNTYTLSDSDVGNLIQVTASYIDNENQAESPVSAPKNIFDPAVGDLTVTLMMLDGPPGASIINPLTTLLNNAIELGLSPNEAAFDIKTVLGIPTEVMLQSYDAYAVLQSVPNDPTALSVEKVAVQVAILTSLSDDDTGIHLTLSIINAAASNQTLDLADLNDLCFIIGVDPQGTLPEAVSVIYDRNKSMSDSLADGGDVNAIETEWVDLCGLNDGIASTSIADLSIHVNQAPVGNATALLPAAIQNDVYIINSNDLLQGIEDPDGDVLSVSALSVDTGGDLSDNGDGTWSFNPFANYSGPVELSYTIEDGQGGSLTASQLFIVANEAPTLTGFSGTIVTTLEHTPVAITLADLKSKGDEADVDGTVDAFVIKSVTSGSLAIGADAASATAYDAGTNNTVDDTHQAFWTPAALQNGTLDAFTAVAQDNSGAESSTAMQATVSVSPNNAPVMSRTSSFAAKVDSRVSNKSLSLTTGDVNGDGNADIIEVYYAKNAISVQSKYGITLTRFDYPAGSSPGSITSTDVNGDNKADLIVANINNNKLSVLINKGNGTFKAKVDYATGLSPHAVTAADINGDGYADLITANSASNTLSVLTNNGDGTFVAKVDYATGLSPHSVTAADVNNDGKADLIAANSAGNTLSVLINSGGGTFADKVDYATGSSPSSVVSTDVNGDGKADLIAANSAGNTISVLINNGDGTFADKVDYATGNAPSSVVSTDVNGDGKADLVVANSIGNTLSVLINKGNGTFAAKADYATAPSPLAVMNADINNDGRPDLIVANSNSWSMHANTSPITTTFIAHTPVAVSSGILVYDPDGDGEWNGGTLHVQITAHAEGPDSLSLPTVSQVGSAIWLDLVSNTLMAGSTAIGTADAPAVYNGDTWNFSFNANATNALVQDVARAISFNNISDTPGTENRAVSFTATDQIGASASLVQTVVIKPVTGSLTPTPDSTIFCHAGNDTLTGGTGNDLMYGGTGNDLLDGGEGDDILIGRAGADSLTGSFGNDIFRFTSESDSGITSATMDKITDFTHGEDKIDLTGIDANGNLSGIQAFSHVILAGTDSFTAPGQLQFDSATGILYGNTDSDLQPEFSIQLLGVTSLAASDLVL